MTKQYQKQYQYVTFAFYCLDRVDTVAGLPAPGHVDQELIAAQFNNPQSVAVHRKEDGDRLLYVADTVKCFF